MSTDTLVHVGQRPSRDFVPTVVGEMRIPPEILFAGSAEEDIQKRNDRVRRNEATGAKDAAEGMHAPRVRGLITCQNADNSTVWS